MKGKIKFYLLIIAFQLFLICSVIFSVDGILTLVSAQTDNASTFDYFNSPTSMYLALSASIAVSSAVLGSAWAIKTVGTAAISSLSEREESFFKAFLIVALCEALAVYGLIVAILLWTKIPQPPAA
jgi:F0F1-type ATP synthase membrane subunit c/vacuolar-type H+-ATPase subunit K